MRGVRCVQREQQKQQEEGAAGDINVGCEPAKVPHGILRHSAFRQHGDLIIEAE